MRTETAINNIINQAKIIYSYKVQVIESERERGLPESGMMEFMEVSNILKAINVSTTLEKDRFCDILIGKGYYQTTTNNLFTEYLYDVEDFDTV